MVPMSDGVFEHAATFERGEVSGQLRLDRYEALYEQLFAEAMEDGVITPEERARLEQAVDSLGLDRQRIAQLERALGSSYQARHGKGVQEAPPEPEEDEAMRPTLSPLDLATDPRSYALARRAAYLEARVLELERELAEARSHVSIEVDFSELATVDTDDEEDPTELQRRLRHDPRDAPTLHALFRAREKRGELDRQWLVAHALVFLGAADETETSLYQRHRLEALVQPTSSVSPAAWRRLLFHPEEEVLTGEFFASIASAVLLGHVAALRQAKRLPSLDPARRQRPETSTVQAVRCFSWAAAVLGMAPPPLYADPELAALVEMVPGVPPASRIGRAALSGRSPAELAFVAGRHLAWFREERFLRLLVPRVEDLEDLFLAALSIGNPGLPLSGEVKRRVEPIAKAIEPILEPAQIDRLRGHFLRFVEEGGRTNLQRWAAAADRTSLRAGLLLANDLEAARAMLELEDPVHLDSFMDDLLVFTISDRYADLRKQLGITIASPSE